MDAWIHSAEAFGIRLGDAHIIRNAGGSAKEALRSLLISQHYLNTNRVMVVKHTGKLAVLMAVYQWMPFVLLNDWAIVLTLSNRLGCGMLGIKNEDIRARVKKNTGTSADHIDFLPFDVWVYLSQSMYGTFEWLTLKQDCSSCRWWCFVSEKQWFYVRNCHHWLDSRSQK